MQPVVRSRQSTPVRPSKSKPENDTLLILLSLSQIALLLPLLVLHLVKSAFKALSIGIQSKLAQSQDLAQSQGNGGSLQQPA